MVVLSNLIGSLPAQAASFLVNRFETLDFNASKLTISEL
jgi:hypothetical protein